MKSNIEFIVHPGISKTGSTSIQHTLANNWRALIEDKILILGNDLTPYFGKGNKPGPSPLLQLCINQLYTYPESSMATNSDIFTDAKKRIQSSVNAAQEMNTTKIVLSAENLSLHLGLGAKLLSIITPPNIQRKVIVYYRRQDLWLESAWKQWYLKISKEPFSEWVIARASEGCPDYLTDVLSWRSYVGNTNLQVKLLEPVFLINGSVVCDFLHILNVTRKIKITRANKNTIYPLPLLKLLHRYNHVLFKNAHDNRLYRILDLIDWSIFPDTSRPLSPEIRKEVLGLFKNVNKNLLENYLRKDIASEEAHYLGLDV
jgi:hypothetical protein